MSTKETLENLAKNTWLAGLGSIDSSKDALSKSIDAAQEKSNSLYSELISRGEEIQNKINSKKEALQAKGKSLFGMGAEKSQEEKIAKLNAKVDDLTTVVVALIEKRNETKTKPATKAKAATKAKPVAKATTKAAPTTKARAKTIASTKSAAKTAAKPAAKGTTKPATKPATKTAAKPATPKTVSKAKAAPKAESTAEKDDKK